MSNFFAEKLYSGLLARLPSACVACGAAMQGGVACEACRASWPRLGAACPRCALPLAAGRGADDCGRCARDPPSLDFARAACAYDFPVDRLVQALKYRGQLALAEPLGEALAAAAREPPLPWRVDALVPLPLARRRLAARGFNQAQLLASVASRRLGVPLLDALLRLRDTPPQATLVLAMRHDNVRDAFAATRRLDGLVVALVDDVMTSGATLEAAARSLSRAGARRVGAFVVARALR